MNLNALCYMKEVTLKKIHSVHDSIYMTFWKRQKYRVRKKTSGFLGLGIGEKLDCLRQ